MKKVVLILMSVFLITGCVNNKGDSLKSFKDYNSKKETYELVGNMKLVSNEDEFTYRCVSRVFYLLMASMHVCRAQMP